MSIAPGRPQRLAVHSIPIEDPGDLVGHLPDASAVAWIRRGDGLIGWGEVTRIPLGPGPDRFARAEGQLQGLLGNAEIADEVNVPGSGAVGFGSFTFDPGAGGSVLVIPQVVMGKRDGRAWLTRIDADDAGGTRGGRVRSPLTEIQPVAPLSDIRWGDGALPPHAWMRAVSDAVAAIHSGRVGKVVLSRDVYARGAHPIDPRRLLDRLVDAYPDCYAFSCAGLVGATPELLVRRDGDRLTSLVLAGSAPRGADVSEDKALGEALLASAKDVAEHEFAVTSVRDVLARRCSELAVDSEPSLLVLANVQHLATAMSGRLGADTSALEVAGALHPTAAVCGTPTDEAMALIRELEGMQRGRYAGPVGWLDARGNGEWGIALRCAEIDGKQARLFAGNGIVAGSDPETELNETQAKLRAMHTALEA